MRNQLAILFLLLFAVSFLLLFIEGCSVKKPAPVLSSKCYPIKGPRSPYARETYERRTILWYGEEMIELHTELRRWPNNIHPQLHGWPHGEMPLETGFRIRFGRDFPYFGYNDWLARRSAGG